MVLLGLVKRSISYTETSTDVSLRAYSRTICHVAPTFGCQLPVVVVLELGLVVLPGDGVLVEEGEGEGEELEPAPDERVKPIPRPTPNPIAIMAKRSNAKATKYFLLSNLAAFFSQVTDAWQPI